jgi:tRNA(fMet)-specific endonuclease VapC
MSGFLLDTDHYTLLELGHLPLLGRLLALPPTQLAIGVVSIEEVLKGRLAALSRARDRESRIRGYDRLARSVETIASLYSVNFNDRAEDIFETLQKSKLRVGTKDLMISAVALAHSMVLLTRNRRDFGRVPGLVIEDWS